MNEHWAYVGRAMAEAVEPDDPERIAFEREAANIVGISPSAIQAISGEPCADSVGEEEA